MLNVKVILIQSDCFFFLLSVRQNVVPHIITNNSCYVVPKAPIIPRAKDISFVWDGNNLSLKGKVVAAVHTFCISVSLNNFVL